MKDEERRPEDAQEDEALTEDELQAAEAETAKRMKAQGGPLLAETPEAAQAPAPPIEATDTQKGYVTAEGSWLAAAPAPQAGAAHLHLLRYLAQVAAHDPKAPASSATTLALRKLLKQAESAAKKAATVSRADRWADACSTAREGLEELCGLKEEYEEWRDNLPENLQQSAVGEKLKAVCDLDLDSAISTIDEAENMELPLGFGRD